MDHKATAKKLVSQMTLEEKASLCGGKDFWHLKGIERLEIPQIMVTDGPHGLRKQSEKTEEANLNQSVPAVCFPTASATACSFDRGLLKEVGSAIAEECKQENVAVLLGPGVNIKRSPLCGRNFEYFSEDPLLAGEMAAAFIDGVQNQNVGVSLKHYAANNQEKRRVVVEAVMDERTYREIYLTNFEIAVKKSKPWTVMCSYNKVDGEYASQNERLLTKILRNEWGFEGIVVSDWGAVSERVKGLQAGLDLEMPGSSEENDQRIVEAVKDGSLAVEKLDETAIRIVELILKSNMPSGFKYKVSEHHKLARKAAGQSAVLLKNDENILPGNATQKAAVIGAFAKEPRYQGSGSSKIAPTSIDNVCDELSQNGVQFEYAPGYRLDSDEIDQKLIDEACQIAKGKDIVYLFAGLPDRYEAEGFDRDDMRMPENHNKLIEAVSQVNPRVVVILEGGAPMETPWAGLVQGILLMYLGGEAASGACVDLLLGKTTPSGKLAETWPFSDFDSPSYGNFPGYPLTVEYREGLFVGYRYYDKAKKAVRFPFGFGLSYTKFEYSNLKISAKAIKDTDTLTVSCQVKNTGSVAGGEAVQLYVALKDSVIIRPEQELKGFEKVWLKPGESKEISFGLSKRDFAYYNTAKEQWHVESGEYEIRIAASSQDVRLSSSLKVESTANLPLPDHRKTLPGYYDLTKGIQISDKEFAEILGKPIPPRERQKGSPHTINSTITDVQDNLVGKILLSVMRKMVAEKTKDNPDMKLMFEAMLMDMPLRFLASNSNGSFSIEMVDGLIEMMNGHFFKGLRKLTKKNK